MFQQKLNQRIERWKGWAYLLWGLVLIVWTFPMEFAVLRERISEIGDPVIVEAEEVETGWRIREEIIQTSLNKGETFGPEDFFAAQAKLVPIRDKFSGKLVVRGQSVKNVIGLSEACTAAMRSLSSLANRNFPQVGATKSRGATVPWEVVKKNRWRWKEAELNAARSEGYEPISISKDQWLAFKLWVFVSYLKLVLLTPFMLIFHLVRRRQSIWQEMVLRPRMFVMACIGGFIGIAIYSGIETALHGRYLKLHAARSRELGTWRLSKQEEAALWVQAEEPVLNFEEALRRIGEVPIKRSRLAVLTSMIAVFLSAPFLAAANAFGSQKNEQMEAIELVLEARNGDEVEEPNDELSDISWVVMDSISEFRAPSQTVSTWFKFVEYRPVNNWASRSWYLPPSLAPPAKH